MGSGVKKMILNGAIKKLTKSILMLKIGGVHLEECVFPQSAIVRT